MHNYKALKSAGKVSVARNEVENIGFFAQEVASVIPEALTGGDKDTVWQNYNNRAIIAVMTKAIQELSAKVEDLKTELQDTKDYVDHKQDYNSMAGRINSCEARIGHLEKG